MLVENLLSDFFLEKITIGEMTIFEAIEEQIKIVKMIERTDKEIAKGEYYESTPEFYEKIMKSSKQNK